MDQDPFTFRVIDLKQYVYCPRILYYQTVLPDVRPITYKMESGIQSHIQAEEREKRRQLRTYGLTSGERSFNVPLLSADLKLSGVLDMLIETEAERIPVDYKDSKKVGTHFKMQVLAYGRLLQSLHPDKPVRRGFLYLIPTRETVPVPFTAHLQRQLDKALTQMAAIAQAQQLPAPPDTPARCVDCEFRRFCNDVL